MVGRASPDPRSPYPSKALGVDPAGVRRRRSVLPREVCVVSAGTEGVERRQIATQKSAEGVVGAGRRNASSAEGPNGWSGE